MSRLLYSLAFSLLISICASAAPLKREDIIAIKAEPVSFNNAPLSTVLLEAKTLAAKHNIHLSVDVAALRASNQEHLTLHAEGLTLDSLLEIAIAGNAMQWKFEERKILFYTTPERRVAQKKRLKTQIHQKLAQIIIPEIAFENLTIPEAYQLVRARAIQVAGTGAVPKIDVPFTPNKPRKINFKVKNTSCLLYTSPSPRDKRQSRMPSSA